MNILVGLVLSGPVYAIPAAGALLAGPIGLIVGLVILVVLISAVMPAPPPKGGE